MPDLNFASVGPGINLFNANMAQGDMQRRLAEEEALRRIQFEQAQGADAAQRAAAAGYFADAGAPAAGAQSIPVQVPGKPVQVPNPAATTPVVSPDQSMNPADNPDYGGPTRAAPAPNVPPRAGVDVPATVTAPPPIAAFSAQPASSAPQAPTRTDRFSKFASTLAQAPGTGSALMNLVGTDLTSQRAANVERQKLHQEGLKLFSDASKNNDVAMMRTIAQRYDFGIPPEVLNRREIMAGIATGMNTAKTLGITDDARALAFAKGFIHHPSAMSADPTAAIEAGVTEAQKTQPPFTAAHFDRSPSGEVLAFDKQGTVKRTGAFAHLPPAAGSSERPTATVQNREDMLKRIKVAYPGIDESFAQMLIVNPHAQATAQDIMRTAANLRKMTNLGRPVYKTEAEVQAAALAAVRGAQQGARQLAGAGGGAAPAAPAAAAAPAPAAAGAPPVRLRFDAAGNQIAQ